MINKLVEKERLIDVVDKVRRIREIDQSFTAMKTARKEAAIRH